MSGHGLVSWRGVWSEFVAYPQQQSTGWKCIRKAGKKGISEVLTYEKRPAKSKPRPATSTARDLVSVCLRPILVECSI